VGDLVGARENLSRRTLGWPSRDVPVDNQKGLDFAGHASFGRQSRAAL